MRARTVARIARRVAHQVVESEQDVKQLDGSISGNIVAATPVGIIPFGTNQGTDYYQRLALETKAISIQVRFRLTLNTAGGATSQLVRFIAVIDTQQAGTGLLLTNTLGTGLFAGAGPVTVEQLRSVFSQDRYRVLKDRVYTVSTGVANQREVNWYHRLWARVHYLDGGSASSSHGPNFMYLIWICNDAANGPAISATSRYSFTDS